MQGDQRPGLRCRGGGVLAGVGAMQDKSRSPVMRGITGLEASERYFGGS